MSEASAGPSSPMPFNRDSQYPLYPMLVSCDGNLHFRKTRFTLIFLKIFILPPYTTISITLLPHTTISIIFRPYMNMLGYP